MRKSVLQPLRARLAGWRALEAALQGLAGVGGLALAMVLADAAFDLPGGLRAAAFGLGAAIVLAPILGALLRAPLLTDEGLAGRLERSDVRLGTKLTNAVHLRRQPGVSSVERYLRSEAVELGRRAAMGLPAWPVLRRGVLAAAACTAVAGLAWLVLALTGVDLIRAVWPRFADPHGDHPPYSRLKIDVTPAGAEVLYGGQVEVHARASGRPVDKLWLVAETATNLTRATMFLTPDKTFFQTLANLREPACYFVTDGHARSYRQRLRIRYSPQITLVEMTMTFPDYTRLPPRTAQLADEALSLPANTRVSFRVASNRPLESGALTLTPVLGGQAKAIALTPDASGTHTHLVVGGFALKEPVAFTVSVRDRSHLECNEPRRGRFNLLPDQRPRLLVLEPGRDAFATPDFRVPVRVQAEDDFGIERVVWLRALNRSLERPFTMKLDLTRGARSVESTAALDLGKLGVRPGDAIQYSFEAADNDPQGPNLALSRIYRLDIISEEQYRAILRQAAARQALFEQYAELGAWLRRLAERARQLDRKATAGTDDPRESEARDAAALAEDLDRYLHQLGQFMEQTALFDVEQAFRQTLGAQQARLAPHPQKLRDALAGGGLSSRTRREVADLLDELTRTENEDVAGPAQRIAAVATLLARADLFVKLAHEQAALAQWLGRFSDMTNTLSRLEQREVQALAEREQQVSQGLRALVQSLPELLGRLPAEDLFEPLRGDVNAFLKAVADAKIEPLLGDACRALSEPDLPSAQALARLAADEMDRLIGKSQGLPGQAQQCLRFKPSLQQAMGNTLAQILAALGSGSGGDGQNGYAWFNNNVGLYGPNMELAGRQGGSRREAGRSGAAGQARLSGGSDEPGVAPAGSAVRVRLQPDARFPLRYRDLVGDYFRAIAESEEQKGESR